MKIGNRVIRTHWLLDKKFQLWHTFFVVLFVGVSSLAFGYIVYLETYARSVYQVMLELNLVNAPDINMSFKYSVFAYLTVFIVIVYSSISWAFFSSHRIAGPAWKFKKVLADIAGGRFNRTVVLRKGDYLKDLAKSFNETLKQMDTKAQSQAGMIHEMQNEIKDLIAILGSANPPGTVLQSTAKKISDNLDRLSSATRYEKTG